jgi:hypothetical protein
VELHDPELCGRIDVVETTHTGDIVIDFKTGREDPDHLDQIDFYAFLWSKATNRSIARRRIIYLNGNRIDRGALSTQDLRALETRYRTRVVVAKSNISSEVRASPAVHTCEYCPVRQLCEPYWSSCETEPLRWKVGDIKSDRCGQWKDLEIDLNECTVTENIIQTAFLGCEDSAVKLRCVVPAKYMASKSEQDTILRLLSVLIRSDNGQVEVVWGSASEAYWK